MNENQNGSFRRKVNFAAVSNNALKDSRLSLKAKGLYALIQSYITLPGKPINKGLLRSKCKEKEKAFDSSWKELKDAGYLKQYRKPSGKNDAFEYEYELLDEANESQPALVTLNKKGEVSVPKHQNQHTPHNGGSANLNSLPDEKAHTPHFVPYANGTPCEQHPMPIGGDINNTQFYKIKKNKINNIKSINQSTKARADGQTDEIRIKLKNQIDYDYFEDNYPSDLPGVNVLLDCMTEMLSRPFTKINGVEQSKYALKTYIDKADTDDIREFINDMKGKALCGIKNINAYLSSSIINYLRDENIASLTI